MPSYLFSPCDGSIMAPAQDPGIDGFHLIERFFGFAKIEPIIGPEEIRRRVKTSGIRAEERLFFFQVSAEAVRGVAGPLDKPYRRTLSEVEDRAFLQRNIERKWGQWGESWGL